MAKEIIKAIIIVIVTIIIEVSRESIWRGVLIGCIGKVGYWSFLLKI